MEESGESKTLWPELEGNGEGGDENGGEVDEKTEEVTVSEWKLEEVAEFTRDLEVYRQPFL